MMTKLLAVAVVVLAMMTCGSFTQVGHAQALAGGTQTLGGGWIVNVYCDGASHCPTGGIIQSPVLADEATAVAEAEAIGDHGCWITTGLCYSTRQSGSQVKIPPGALKGLLLSITD